ncbi:ribose 5-phosphate isomerase B [candidate division KSB3 bacterium]|uniref:Ribose 5-phosphate isomerase B n=1 Tax=candidate division KSB3 bacterium TaxID=2044937 RepID=A0A2G6EAU3_9BACT|nr:MAG: ribose 5-phosphate isomerase B [candidate division KSB3 bacterium]PIE30761.1 MAG: ribose 5-phosphate isomerase B [candidate division KSB3 bacterium]
MNIGLGSDHAGFELKEYLKNYLQDNFPDLTIIDFGTHDTTSTSYAIYGKKVAHALVQGEIERGIVICGSGLGISMAAGKVKGVRAALCHDEYTARMSRLHNDANVLAIGGRIIGKGLAQEMVTVWLKTAFEGGRHQTRVEQIEALAE